MPRTAVLLTLLALTACKSLPPLSERDESRYIPTRSAPRLEAALQLPDNDGASAPAAASETGQPENPAARRQPETPPLRFQAAFVCPKSSLKDVFSSSNSAPAREFARRV